MAKAKTTAFFCKECGYESAKWTGQCPACKEWNTMVEEPISPRSTGKPQAVRRTSLIKSKPSLLCEISVEEKDRVTTGYDELDRVLGGGVVSGSLVLVGGDPGIGKSTLLLQVCRNLAAINQKVLYISGEESLKQIKLRANRIGEITGELKAGYRHHRLHSDHVPGRDRLSSRQRQPGKRINQPSHADSQGRGGHHLYRRSCDQRRSSGRSQSLRAYGRHGALL